MSSHIDHPDPRQSLNSLIVSSTVSGLPPFMWNCRQHDTTMFQESKDPIETPEASRDVGPSTQSSQSESLSKRREGIVINDHTATSDVRELGEDTDARQMVAVGRILTTHVMRDIVGRQVDLAPWSSAEVKRFQDIIEQMSVQVRARIDKLGPQQGDLSRPVEPLPINFADDDEIRQMRYHSIHSWTLVPNPHNSVFLTWSRRLLNLMIEKTHCTLYNPLPKSLDRALWQEFRET